MLIFHEGLPGSGKSFEAMVSHIVPALKKGRKVFAYVEGLDHDKIASVAEITPESCRGLLHQITREQVPDVHQHVENDALVVIDELQNFFPSGRSKLTPEITQFVTEHRHRGLDILCMGQVLGDCHKLWQGRIDTKIVFRKLDSIGKVNSYRWTVFKRDQTGRFLETTSGKRDYDPKYFGTYKSHTDGTENTGTYVDERANVKNGKVFRMIKYYGIALAVAIAFIVWFFASGGGGIGQKKPAVPPSSSSSSPPPAAAPVSPVPPGQPAEVKPSRITVSQIVGQMDMEASDYIDKITEKNRIRLAGSINSPRSIVVTIEWRDDSNRVMERLTADQLRGLGWYVMLSTDGGIASVSKPGRSYIATQWPVIDDRAAGPEKVPEAQQRQIAPQHVQQPQQVAINDKG